MKSNFKTTKDGVIYGINIYGESVTKRFSNNKKYKEELQKFKEKIKNIKKK